jgi:hypothetical protein
MLVVAAVLFSISRIAQLHLVFHTDFSLAGQANGKQTGSEKSASRSM